MNINLDFDIIARQCITYLLLCSLLGTVVYLSWKVVGKWAEKRGYIDFSYWIWKFVLLSFWFPASFLVLLRIRNMGLYGFDFWYTKPIFIATIILISVWLVGMFVCVLKYRKRHRKIDRMVKEEGYIDTTIKIQVEELSKRLKLHRKVQPIILDFIEVPMAYGLIHPKILLPQDEYEEETLRMILLHELTHHKQHDLFWKQFFQITRCVYWFHPAMNDILKQIDQWGETSCDMKVSKQIRSLKTYFNVVISMAVGTPRYDVYTTGLCEGTDLVILRMQRMNTYKKKRPIKGLVAIAIIISLVGISAVTVMASSFGYAIGYCYVTDQTEENDTSDWEDIKMPNLKEKVKQLDKNSETVIMKEKIPKKEDAISFDYDIKSGQRLKSKKAYLEKGTVIEININFATDEDDGYSKDYETGVVDMKGHAVYIDDNWNLWHRFEIKESGYYRIYMENYGKSDMENVVGMWSR